MAPVELRRGYILHQRPLSDSRKIIDIFTPISGRVTGTIRVGKKKSPLMLFQPCLFSWLGRGELKTFTHHETSGMPFPLLGRELYCAFYLNELLQRLLPAQEEMDELFSMYESLLGILSEVSDAAPYLRRFELLLLRCLGYEYSFEMEGYTAEPIMYEGSYRFDPQQGFSRVSPQHIGAFAGRDLLACAHGEASEVVQQLLKRICREAIAARLGRDPLKSRDFFLKP